MPVDGLRGPLGGGVVAAHVYFVGILLKSRNDELHISSDGGGPDGRGGVPCARAPRPTPKIKVAPTLIRTTFLIDLPPSINAVF